MLKMFKKLVKEAEETYKYMVETTIKATIRKNLPYDVDEAVTNFYAVVYSPKTCDEMDDKTWNYIESCQLKEDKLLRAEMAKCGDAIYDILVELDEWCEVSWAVYYEGGIEYTIKVDGMEFIIKLDNRFDNQ